MCNVKSDERWGATITKSSWQTKCRTTTGWGKYVRVPEIFNNAGVLADFRTVRV